MQPKVDRRLDRNHPIVVERVLSNQRDGSDELVTTVVSFEEQIKGRLAQIGKSATDPVRLVTAYKRLAAVLDSFVGISILDYGAEADTRFREFRQAGIRIGTQDLRIASIVLASNGILVTRNRRDFEQVAGLSVQD